MNARRSCIVALALLLAACGDDPTTPGAAPEEAPPLDAGEVVLDRLAPPHHVLGSLFGEARRADLGHGLAHYDFDVPLGPDAYDVVRIHRVVRERRPGLAERTRGAVFMVHGASQGFADIYLWESASSGDPRASVAGYLASRGIDVWGVDLSWTLIPPLGPAPDLAFMQGWDVAREVDHVLASMSIARALRGLSGQGPGPMNLLGFSYSVPIAYAAATRETREAPLLRDIAGLVAVDGLMKHDPADEFHRLASCAEADNLQALIDGGVYHNSNGTVFSLFGQLAATAPDDASPLIPGLTNYQAILAIGASPRPTPAPGWHFVAGRFDASGLPSGLLYTDPADWINLAASLPPYMPLPSIQELATARCAEADVPFDDHLADVAVPILYLGAGGGLGTLGFHMSALTGSDDVTHHVASVAGVPPILDIGHADLLMADDAPALAWDALRDWLVDHDARGFEDALRHR